MNIREKINKGVLICDGAMGTYYSEITGNDSSFCEVSNLTDRGIIEKIHKEYIDSGAMMIRTNTFSANKFTLNKSREEIDAIIRAGINIAKEVTQNKDVIIAGNIGPIRNEEIENSDELILNEYEAIIDVFLQENINVFLFETFSNTLYLKEISKYIKNKNKDAFIIFDFAVKPDGFSRDGIRAERIFKEIEEIEEIDAVGLNCASGPTMTLRNIKRIDYYSFGKKIFVTMPNAGFPMIVHERSVFTDNPDFFSDKIKEIAGLGVKIVGGCCGTKPSYIKSISDKLNSGSIPKMIGIKHKNLKISTKPVKVENSFIEKLNQGKFVTAVELSAPVDTSIEKMMSGAKLCKENNIDLVTVPDSPMGRVRANSVLMASKIKREFNIEAMPHMCCRDKNINAIRSEILGAHIENIRNILAITGDPVSDAKTSETKGVFNLNSFKLIKLIKDINEDIFSEDEISVGGALNLNVINKKSEYERMKKKIDNGAQFFLTQPIYCDETIEYIRKIKKETDIKILGGILPIVTYRNAMFLNNELPGVTIPKHMIDKFSKDMSKEEAEAIGIGIAVEIGKKLKEVCDGLYFVTPFNRVSMIMKIIKEIDNL